MKLRKGEKVLKVKEEGESMGAISGLGASSMKGTLEIMVIKLKYESLA